VTKWTKSRWSPVTKWKLISYLGDSNRFFLNISLRNMLIAIHFEADLLRNLLLMYLFGTV